ncbi:ribosome hibernation-promoting factor, HPF/YfiA family [Candidatus Neomarinimicrobiota bacterium]
MQIEVTARHFKAPQELRDLIDKKVHKLDRYFDGVLNCRVVLSSDDGQEVVDIIAHSKKHMFTVRETGQRVDRVVARAVRKLKIQLKRHKDRLTDK